jgi:hypothetical protein
LEIYRKGVYEEGCMGGLIVFGLAIYFIPSVVACVNKKDNAGAIVLLDIFLGWTFVGWVIALVWAVTKDKS